MRRFICCLSFFMLGDIITTWKSEGSDPEVNSTSTEQKYEQEYIVEHCTDNYSSACVENSISPETIMPKLTGQAPALRAKAFQKTTSSPTICSIKQGQTKYHKAVVPSGVTCLDIQVIWKNKNNSLSLTVKPPTGGSGGTYNGTGSITLRRDKNVQETTWGFEVKGVSVSGTEKYTFQTAFHN